MSADPLVVETVERLLADICAPDTVEQAEASGWSADIWEPLAETGFPWVSLPEEAGGAGGTLYDAAAILRGVGAHAAPVPVAETGVLAGWLSTSAGIEIPAGPATVFPTPLESDDGRLRGTAIVAWAEQAERVVGLTLAEAGWHVVSLRPDQITTTPGTNIAGEPRPRVGIDVAVDEAEMAPAPVGVDADALTLRGAWSRVVLAAGALEALVTMTIDYTHEREQFGRPVARFQAVQHHLVTVTQASVKASMAAEGATRALANASTAAEAAFEIASARVVVNAAGTEGTRSAHQAHGAMGVTREYPLHLRSRRLWSWHHEYEAPRHWIQRVGQSAIAAGADDLFPLISR